MPTLWKTDNSNALAAASAALPLLDTVVASDVANVARLVAESSRSGRAVYPVGAGTALDLGPRPAKPGLGLSLARLTRVIDHPARDLTITVEAGITVRALARKLAAEGQRLPVDVPHADRATLGGALACNTSGPRRCGWGTLRDYVIGLRAVDGCGVEYGSGGRVVKNAAGYDLGRLLIGSLGTLGVVTQVTLMVRPIPETSALVVAELADLDAADRLLAAMARTKTLPVAVELLIGPAWGHLSPLPVPTVSMPLRAVVGFEGSSAEVQWMIGQITAEWQALGVAAVVVPEKESGGLWDRLIGFSATTAAGATDDKRPSVTDIVVHISVPPSAVVKVVGRLWEIDHRSSIQSHASNGIIKMRLPADADDDVRRLVRDRLWPMALSAGGHLAVSSAPAACDLTIAEVWGPPPPGWAVMKSIKTQFDPHHVLNPGRYIFAST